MKLYYAPGTCALSPHIVLREAGLPYSLVKVDIKSKRTADGEDYNSISPKGYVPALELDDGTRLTEGPVIAQYLADQRPDSGLAPHAGTLDRYRVQEWLGFINSEVHKSFSPLFRPDIVEPWKKAVSDNIIRRFDFIAAHLANRQFLVGDGFTIADAYLYTVLRWSKPFGFDLARWPALAAYFDRIDARPTVQEALREEGMLKNRAA
jgi:glutathione S-transferase